MSLTKHKDVFWLGMFDCEASPYALSQLLSALKNNKALVHLDLGRNTELGDEGIAMLCQYLELNKVNQTYSNGFA